MTVNYRAMERVELNSSDWLTIHQDEDRLWHVWLDPDEVDSGICLAHHESTRDEAIRIAIKHLQAPVKALRLELKPKLVKP